MSIVMFDPVAALMGVLREQFAQSGVIGVTHSAGVVPLHGWLSAHHALPNLLDKAGRLHDSVFPTRYPYLVEGGRLISQPASFLQYMAAISATVMVIGLVIDDCLDAGQIDQNGILHDDSRFCV